MAFWLVTPHGRRLRLTHGGLLLGRHGRCDLVFSDSKVSRHQAVVRLGTAGPEVFVMGTGVMRLNDAPIEGTAALGPGNVLTLPDASTLAIEETTEASSGSTCWVLQVIDGERIGLPGFPFTLGGGPYDDVQWPGWPAAALTFRQAQAALFVETSTPAGLNGRVIPISEHQPIGHGDLVTVGSDALRLLAVADETLGATERVGSAPGIDRVALQFLPNGGQLQVWLGATLVELYLSELRFSLLATLLAPPAPTKPGDFIDDDALCRRIWPRNNDKDRTHINVLIKRVRDDLVRSGLNGFALLQRSPGGGGTRFTLPPGAVVTAPGS